LQGPSLSGGPDVEGRKSVAAVFVLSLSLSLSLHIHAPGPFLRPACLLLALLHEHGDGRT